MYKLSDNYLDKIKETMLNLTALSDSYGLNAAERRDMVFHLLVFCRSELPALLLDRRLRIGVDKRIEDCLNLLK